jgi:hypothetical protein
LEFVASGAWYFLRQVRNRRFVYDVNRCSNIACEAYFQGFGKPYVTFASVLPSQRRTGNLFVAKVLVESRHAAWHPELRTKVGGLVVDINDNQLVDPAPLAYLHCREFPKVLRGDDVYITENDNGILGYVLCQK